ncbi:MAG: hypothetical protein HY541_03490 [Deltaproteobacteria bacterium]|nr:hypothetical protein [Deltaproteobacteria bacterium]
MLKRTIMFVACGVIIGAAGYSTASGKGDCKSDLEKFCSGVEKGGGRIIKCLHEHLNELSSECKENVENRDAVHTACKSDREKYCADEKGKGGKPGKCLKEHEADLSTACKDAMAKAKED